MQAGYYISGGLHAAFLAVLLFGGLFARDRLPPVSVADVTVLSEEEFAALVPPADAPGLASEAPRPAVPQTAPPPEVPRPESAPERNDAPEAGEPAVPDEAVRDIPEPVPSPPAEVTDTAPMIAPPAAIDAQGIDAPDAAPAPAPRVAPEAAPPPPPQALTAPETAPEIADAPDAPIAEETEESEASAPEEATTEIVTEAEERPEVAPARSMVPRQRPARPIRNAAADAEPAPEISAPDEDVLAAAISEAGAGSEAGSEPPSGPPMTQGERDAFRLSVQRCWVVDVGSASADVTVTVGFSLDTDGRVVDGRVTRLEASGGDERAINTAFEAARRAVLRCGASGFDLPVDKYDRWRDIEITFNPEGMRLR